MFGVFVGLSCFLGTYFTLHKEYGYSMGDSFTLAAYVLAIGMFVSSAVLAHQYQHCRCWKRSKNRKMTDSFERASLTQSRRNALARALNDLGLNIECGES
jgi:hypothetical protein